MYTELAKVHLEFAKVHSQFAKVHDTFTKIYTKISSLESEQKDHASLLKVLTVVSCIQSLALFALGAVAILP